MTRPTNLMPPAVSALRDAWRAALPVETDPGGFVVYLGAAPDRPFSPRAVTVAASWDQDLDPVTVERTESGAGRRVTESIDVACSVFVGSGGVPDMDAWRVQVGETLQLLDNALRGPRLADMAARSRRGYTRWWDWWDTGGDPVGAVADFMVHLVVLP